MTEKIEINKQINEFTPRELLEMQQALGFIFWTHEQDPTNKAMLKVLKFALNKFKWTKSNNTNGEK